MAFYPIPFGHAEVHTDPRPKRPAEYAGEIAKRTAPKASERRSR